ncbi:MAG: hypothetical protein M3040_11510, partial [Bacteroidota bacterium]|nr:hypothetical protein [Bacteroidota bacterium]
TKTNAGDFKSGISKSNIFHDKGLTKKTKEIFLLLKLKILPVLILCPAQIAHLVVIFYLFSFCSE